MNRRVWQVRLVSTAAGRGPPGPGDSLGGFSLVEIGEETGELEKMLGKIADFYEDEVDVSISSLTSIIAMYLPMFKMLTLVK